MQPYQIVLTNLTGSVQLRSFKTISAVTEQLRNQDRRSSDSFRYKVTVEILEGQRRPATDIDNYAKPILDAITVSQLLWSDDEQIDEIVIRRRKVGSNPETRVTMSVERVLGQHSGVPTFFHAGCVEASMGSQWTYAHPAYHLAIHLESQQPYDLENDEWIEEIERLTTLLDNENDDGVWEWFCAHFPKCMALVPNRRKEQFILGVQRAYEDERIGY